MYTIYSRSTNRNEPVQGETITQAQQNYVEYRRRVSGTSFGWDYYAQRGYVVKFMPKKLNNTVNDRKLVSNN